MDTTACGRCGMPGATQPPASANLVEIAAGYALCKNGRDCVLRYKRKRRNATVREVV
jgi:hypothetical protein